MHAVLNAQLLSDQAGYRSAGMSNYVRNLLAALGPLAAGDPAWQLAALTHTPAFRAEGIAGLPRALPGSSLSCRACCTSSRRTLSTG